MNRLRNNIREFSQDVLSRILNVMIPIQKMFIALMDTFQKIQGVMTSGLYTMLGSYYTLQSLMGAILELIIKILMALVIIIVGLWILPFTWPAAASMTGVFLAISIPLSIIIYFMTEVLHIKTSAIPKLRCFDRKTKFFLIDGTFKFIEELKPLDTLLDGSIVTAKIKVTSKDLDMYYLNDIIISESHIVNYNNKWIKVKEHPNAIKLTSYKEPYLYCINTTSKTIVLNNTIFTDWDEVYDDDLSFLLEHISFRMSDDLFTDINFGFKKETKIKMINGEKPIDKIFIGERVSTGGVVYGIVELMNDLGNEQKYNLLVSNEKFEVENTIYLDFNNNIDSILKLKKILSKEYV